MLQAADCGAAEKEQPKRIAGVVSVYYHNSHADVIVSRLLETQTLDGKGRRPELELVSLYTDQVPENDKSRELSRKYDFPIYESVRETLTLGTGELAVDGVLLVAEHGKYPKSPTGNTIYPKRRLFEEVVKVFRESGRVVPVFIDKHLADNWKDAKWIYDTAREMKIPLMAGSSLPVLWRYPPADVGRGQELEEITAVSYHTLDGYGFHALEMVQCLAEQRAGGETGIKAVQCLVGDAVWEAGERGVYNQELLASAITRLKHPSLKGQDLKKRVREPVLWHIEYADGLKTNVLTLNGAVAEWAVAWRDKKKGTVQSTLFWTQEARPFMHFGYLLNGIEKMMLTGEPAWPVERTLLTSGVLDALLISKGKGGKRLPTPHLEFSYQSDWRWKEPPPPPPGRPIQGQ